MTPEEQAAVDSYLQGGGQQSAVDAYFAGNPSQDQFMQDAQNYWNVDATGAPLGESQYSGTNMRPDGSKPNTGAWAPGSGDKLRDPWEQIAIDPRTGQPADKQYIIGPNGDIIKWQGGAAPAPGSQGTPPAQQQTGTEPSIFDFFNQIFSQFQGMQPRGQQQQPQQQQQQQQQARYAPGFQPGGANDPMIIQNAIQNQSDPNSMAGLFNKMADSFNTLQQGQGGAQPIMSGGGGMGYGGYSPGSIPQYQNQYVAPPPPAPVPTPAPTPTTPTAPAPTPTQNRTQQIIDKAKAAGKTLPGRSF